MRIVSIRILAALAAWSAPGLAATLTVDTLTDSDAQDASCSLREAIVAANTDGPYNGCPTGDGDDVIELGAGTILLTADLPQITANLTVRGPGASEATIDGDGAWAIFDFDTSVSLVEGTGDGLLVVEGVTLTRGLANAGPAIHLNGGEDLILRDCAVTSNAGTNGGAVHSDNDTSGSAALTIERCLFYDNENQGSFGGGGLRVGIGGSLTIDRTTFLQNRAPVSTGGGLSAIGSPLVTIRRSTFSGNSAGVNGGALDLGANTFAPDATIESTTIVGNTCGADDDGGNGGGIYLAIAPENAVKIRNTIVALNVDSGASLERPDLSGNFESLGFNLVGDNTSVSAAFPASIGNSPNTNGDYVGTSASPLDPLLGAIADNGGPTPTHLPEADAMSPIIDRGSCSAEPVDQRGFYDEATWLRIFDAPIANVDDGCDVGAVERGAIEPPDGFLFGSRFERQLDGWSDVVGAF